jgi:hypothetical protein
LVRKEHREQQDVVDVGRGEHDDAHTDCRDELVHAKPDRTTAATNAYRSGADAVSNSAPSKAMNLRGAHILDEPMGTCFPARAGLVAGLIGRSVV